MLTFQTPDQDHQTQSILYEKKHEAQFSFYQILKDENEKKNSIIQKD
jgi:hypothetical protein